MGRAYSAHGEMRNVYAILVGKPLGKLRRSWDDNIIRDLREISWEYVDLMHLDQNWGHLRAVVNT
jgi:hypothetical protein